MKESVNTFTNSEVQSEKEINNKIRIFPFCCESSEISYFYGFTLFNLLLAVASITTLIFYTFYIINTQSIVGLILCILVFLWFFYIFAKFKQTKDFGNTKSLIMAILLIVIGLVSSLFIIVVTLLDLGFKIKFIPDILELNFSTILVSSLVLLFFNAYYIYLSFMYLKIVLNQRTRNKSDQNVYQAKDISITS